MNGVTLLRLLVIYIATSTLAFAEENPFKLIFSGGLTFGGETLAETFDGSTLDSGGLILLSIGGLYEFEGTNFQLQTSVGYHFDELSANNGSADFSRTYIEIIPFYKLNETVRLGVGYARIMSPSYSDPYNSIDFKDANALITEISWGSGSNSSIWWGLRYAKTEYIVEKINGYSVGGLLDEFPIDGDYFGLIAHIGFN